MFTASFYFLGVAIFILAASVCLCSGKRTAKVVAVDINALRTVSVCLPAGRTEGTDRATAMMYKELSREEKARWHNVRMMWLRWYERCQREAMLRQSAMYSWARTLALSAVLCLMGVLLEAEFDQPITLHTILTGFRRPTPAAADCQTQHGQPYPMATARTGA